MYHHVRTKLQLPFRFLEPTIYSGLLDDPLLLLRNRPEGTNFLIDCGQNHHLAKRVLKAVEAVFISHAHMDHFMGMASFARNILVSTRTVDIYGPPGLSTRLENLLSSFDWNLCENFWCSFRVLEIEREAMQSFLLPGPEGFRRRPGNRLPRDGHIIFSNKQVEVSAAACDHKIPSLIYRVDEQPAFMIDEEKLLDKGLKRGDWLREMNSRYNRGELGKKPITVLSAQNETVVIDDAAELYRNIRVKQTPQSIGYLTDIGWGQTNRAVVNSLLSGINMLIAECTYASADVDKARASCHLCSDDLNELMSDLTPDYVVPIHVSKSYQGDTGRIFSELQPPAGTTLLRLPDHIVPPPLLPDEIPGPEIQGQ